MGWLTSEASHDTRTRDDIASRWRDLERPVNPYMIIYACLINTSDENIGVSLFYPNDQVRLKTKNVP